jgi:TolB-like protein/DNA-binding winged helix-turn-helix (wHTH) protein/Flp pilus assembly protein TadD
MLYRFGEFELDEPRHELRLQGEPLPLQPRVLALLFHLAKCPERVVTKAELLDEVWGGAIVVEAALTRAISVLRSTLGDTDRDRRLIVTVPGIGYRFATPIAVVPDDTRASADAVSGDRAQPAAGAGSIDRTVPRRAADAERRAVLDRPALAVLPFVASGPATDGDDHFADGIAEEVMTALSYWKRFPVIGRRSAFAYRGSLLGIREIAEALEARYVLEGTIRRAGDRIRISVELSDAALGRQLWSERYERPIGDVFALQDEICEQIVRGIEPELARAEIERAIRKPPGSLDAWELELKATANLYVGTRESIVEAGRLIERALELEPTCPHGNSLMALYHFENGLLGGIADASTSLGSALSAARKACRYDPRDWLAHALLGITTLWVERDHEKAIELVERAIELNPSGARSYQFIGCVYEFAGRIAEAAEALETALRLDPMLQSQALVLSDLALCHLLLGEHEEALRLCGQALQHDPENGRALQRSLCALGHLGDRERAAATREALLGVQPDFSSAYLEATYPFLRASDRDHFYAGLAKAGIGGLPTPPAR